MGMRSPRCPHAARNSRPQYYGGYLRLLATLAELTDFPEAKADAISVLSQHGDAIDVLVMLDG
jgi:hypothetical protein